MNINIICIGKLKESFYKDGCSEYIKRLSRFTRLKITELPESKSDDINEESEDIIRHIDRDSYVIALDVGGKRLNSMELAGKLSALGVSGHPDIDFIIGGSNGYNDEVRKKADLRLSFSDFTFPHQLMRLILLEQVYRSFKINAGEKYHK